jgi:hypothetical protein
MRRFGWLGTAALLAVVVSGCGGPVVAKSSPPIQGPIPAASSVPAASSYGHGSWAFSVSFLATPRYTGVGRTPLGQQAVARDIYQARFKTNVGMGVEHLLILEFPHRLTGCVQRFLFGPKSSCGKPHGDILASGVQGCLEHFDLLGIVCHGYLGGVIALKGTTVYNLQVVSANPATVRTVLDTFSPHVSPHEPIGRTAGRDEGLPVR